MLCKLFLLVPSAACMSWKAAHKPFSGHLKYRWRATPEWHTDRSSRRVEVYVLSFEPRYLSAPTGDSTWDASQSLL